MSNLPFSLTFQRWSELSGNDRYFFADEQCLSVADADRIQVIVRQEAKLFTTWALEALPPGWPDHSGFPIEKHLNIQHKWNEEKEISSVRQWLFECQIPFSRTVYLIYDYDCVVQTQWKLLVKYWNQFAWSVGYAMTCIDHTQQWACSFHHEDVILFGTY